MVELHLAVSHPPAASERLLNQDRLLRPVRSTQRYTSCLSSLPDLALLRWRSSFVPRLARSDSSTYLSIRCLGPGNGVCELRDGPVSKVKLNRCSNLALA